MNVWMIKNHPKLLCHFRPQNFRQILNRWLQGKLFYYIWGEVLELEGLWSSPQRHCRRPQSWCRHDATLSKACLTVLYLWWNIHTLVLFNKKINERIPGQHTLRLSRAQREAGMRITKAFTSAAETQDGSGKIKLEDICEIYSTLLS